MGGMGRGRLPEERVGAELEDYDERMRVLLPQIMAAEVAAASWSDAIFDRIDPLVQGMFALDVAAGDASALLYAGSTQARAAFADLRVKTAHLNKKTVSVMRAALRQQRDHRGTAIARLTTRTQAARHKASPTAVRGLGTSALCGKGPRWSCPQPSYYLRRRQGVLFHRDGLPELGHPLVYSRPDRLRTGRTGDLAWGTSTLRAMSRFGAARRCAERMHGTFALELRNGRVVPMGATRIIRLNERVAATVEQAAAAEGVEPEQWVNDRLARDLFLEKLQHVQTHNFEPISEEQATEVVYGS